MVVFGAIGVFLKAGGQLRLCGYPFLELRVGECGSLGDRLGVVLDL